MTPKEKALQLVDKFCFGMYPWQIKKAKQCALICVDEIIYVIDTQKSKWLSDYVNHKAYWQEVKQEIGNL